MSRSKLNALDYLRQAAHADAAPAPRPPSSPSPGPAPVHRTSFNFSLATLELLEAIQRQERQRRGRKPSKTALLEEAVALLAEHYGVPR